MRRLSQEIKKTAAELKVKEPEEDQLKLVEFTLKPTTEVVQLRKRLQLLKDAEKIIHN